MYHDREEEILHPLRSGRERQALKQGPGNFGRGGSLLGLLLSAYRVSGFFGN